MPQIKPVQPLPPAPRWGASPTKLYSNITSKIGAVNSRTKANVKPMVVAQPRVVVRNNSQSKKPTETKSQPTRNIKIVKQQTDNIYENIKISSQNDKLKSALTNFDKIINEYNTMSASSDNLSGKNLTSKQQSKSVSIPNTPSSVPKLQKSKTCSIIEAHCILKSPSDQQTSPQDVKTRLVRKTLQPATSLTSQERAKSVWDVSASPPKIATRARSTSCVRSPSKIPVKKPQKPVFPRTASADQFSNSDRGNVPIKPNAKLSLPIKACVEKFEAKSKAAATPIVSSLRSQEVVASKRHTRRPDARYVENVPKKLSLSPKILSKDVPDYLKCDPGREYNSDCSEDSGHISNENEPQEPPKKISELLEKFEKRKTSVDHGYVEHAPAPLYQPDQANKSKEVHEVG